MGIGDTLDFHGLVEIAGSGNGGVGKGQDLVVFPDIESFQRYVPATSPRRSFAKPDVSARRDQRLADACGGEGIEHPVGCVTFRDAAEIEGHVFP
jgi:hypothetical protein